MADAPVDALLRRVGDLAKGWLLALLEQAPLEDAPAILAVDLSRDGPRICDAVVRALADETDLHRLEPGGALEMLVSRAGAFARSGGPESTSRAVDALQAVTWSAIRDELYHPDPDQVSELAERLTLVIEAVRTAALRRFEDGGVGPAAGVHEEPGPRGEPTGPGEERPRPGPFGQVRPGPMAVGGPRPGPRVVHAEGHPGSPSQAPEGDPGSASQAPDPGSASSVADPRGASRAPHPEGPSAADALWVAAVEDEVIRAERTGSPLSLLLAELEEADRVSAVEPSAEANVTFGRFAQAVRGVVRRHDILACETDTRAWIISRDTGRTGARALAERIARAVRAAPPWRGAPMAVSVGVAVFGEDGHDAASLIEGAEQARFAASASGLAVVPEAGGPDDTPLPEQGPEPGGPGPSLAG